MKKCTSNLQGDTTKARESSEHQGFLVMGGGSFSSLTLLLLWEGDEEPQSGRSMTLAGRPEQLGLAAVHLLADAFPTQEPQDCVVVGCGDHIHKLEEDVKIQSFNCAFYFNQAQMNCLPVPAE